MHEVHYKGAIWTTHARERLGHRGLTQERAASAFTHPDVTRPGKKGGTTEFIKRVNNSTITLIGAINEQGEWVIISCWIDPPIYGYMDHQKQVWQQRYYKAGFWGKFWMIVKQQLGF